MLPERPRATKIGAKFAYPGAAAQEARGMQKTSLNSNENLVFVRFGGVESDRPGG